MSESDDPLDDLVNTTGALSERAKKAVEEHVEEYKKLILKMAHKYKRHRVEYEDLVQEAMIGLILADRDFDETRSSDFHTYAIYRMKGKMYEYCIANESPIYVPTHVAKAASYVKQMQRLLEHDQTLLAAGIGIEAIIREEKHKDEVLLPEQIREELKELKRKLGRIAFNSKMNYERLARMAFESISLIISDDVLVKFPKEEILDDIVSNKELGEQLRESLGEKRFVVLEMRSSGWNFREIAEELFRRGYTNKKGECISRQAVKGILDETIKAIQKSKIFSESGS